MSDIEEFNISSPLVNFGFRKKNHTLHLKEGESIIIRKNIGTFWHRKYIRKAYTLKDGKVKVTVLV